MNILEDLVGKRQADRLVNPNLDRPNVAKVLTQGASMLFSSPRQMVKDEDRQDFGTNILEKHMNISTHAMLIGIFVSYYSQNTLQS